MKQNGLFSNLPMSAAKKQEPKKDVQPKPEKKEKPQKQIKPRKDGYIPAEGDRVLLSFVQSKVEVVVEYVDYKNLYKDHFYPIQTYYAAENRMIRATLQDIELLERGPGFDPEAPPWID